MTSVGRRDSEDLAANGCYVRIDQLPPAITTLIGEEALSTVAGGDRVIRGTELTALYDQLVTKAAGTQTGGDQAAGDRKRSANIDAVALVYRALRSEADKNHARVDEENAPRCSVGLR